MALPQSYVPLTANLYQFLDTDGDESGTIEALGNYVTPTDFFIKPPAGILYELTRVIIMIQCGSVIGPQEYGDQAALTNGIKVYTYNGSSEAETLINKIPIKTHDDWAGICFDSVALNYGNVAGRSIAIRWTFSKSGQDFNLNGNNEDKLIFRLNDNFSGLDAHRFFIQGHKHTI